MTMFASDYHFAVRVDKETYPGQPAHTRTRALTHTRTHVTAYA